MNDHHTDAMLVRELLEPSDDLIVVGIAIRLSTELTHLLQGINDDKSCIGMLLQEPFKLFIQSVSELFRVNGEVEIRRSGCETSRSPRVFAARPRSSVTAN